MEWISMLGRGLNSTEPCRCLSNPVAREVVEDRCRFCGGWKGRRAARGGSYAGTCSGAFDRSWSANPSIEMQFSMADRWSHHPFLALSMNSRARSRIALSIGSNRSSKSWGEPSPLHTAGNAHGVDLRSGAPTPDDSRLITRRLRHLQFQSISRRDRAFQVEVGAVQKERDFVGW